MNRKLWRRAAAGMLTLALAAGALPSVPADCFQLIPALTADAADMVVQFDAETHELVLSGDLQDSDELLSRIGMIGRSEIEILTAEPGTVFPARCSGLFSGMPNLTEVDFSGADFSAVDAMDGMFSACPLLRTVKLRNLQNPSVRGLGQVFVVCDQLETVDFTGTVFRNAETIDAMFVDCHSLKKVIGLAVDSPYLTSAAQVFARCYALESVDLSRIHTDHVTNFNGMFMSCRSLTSLDLSTLETGSAEYMNSMFYDCPGLRTLDLSGFETANVTDLSYMFWNCRSLRSVEFGDFDTRKVSNMSYMFNGCQRLRDLDLSGFETEGGVNVRWMFNSCSDLTELDLSGLDSRKFTSSDRMFEGAVHLKRLTLGSGFTEVTEGMRLTCPYYGWVNELEPDTVVSVQSSSYAPYALFENIGQNTYLCRGDYGEITGTKLLLTEDGTIGLRFYAGLSDLMSEDERDSADIWFFLSGAGNDMKQVRARKDGMGRYYADITVAAKNMADLVEADLYFYSEQVRDLPEGADIPTDVWSGQIDRVYYSVRDYADVILDDPVVFEKEQNIIKSMLVYGGAAQRHFGYHNGNETFEESCADRGISYTGPALQTVNSFVRPEALSGISYYGTSVVLEALTVQRHYFRLTDGEISDYSFTVDGEAVAPEDYGDMNLYYIDTPGVTALNLDRVLTIAVSRGDARMEYWYSALDYIRLGVQKKRLSGTAAEAATALGWLSLEAKNYQNS